MKNACTNLYIVTDDGSNGRKALAMQVLKELIDAGKQPVRCRYRHRPDDHDEVCLRDHPVRTASRPSFHEHHQRLTVPASCGGCRLTVGGETKFACVDGPDFDSHLVDFDSAMRRGAMYKAQERAGGRAPRGALQSVQKEVK